MNNRTLFRVKKRRFTGNRDDCAQSLITLLLRHNTASEKIGNVQSELFKPSAGKTSDALLSHQKSLEIREKLSADSPENIRIKRDLEATRRQRENL